MALETSELTETFPVVGRSKLREIMSRGRRLLAAIEHRLEKRHSRRRLSELTEDELRDIGLTGAQARAEASKSWFWS
ncbi:DUF1127 domain-containing protein [Rhizobium sp. Pop5]|uniref:DUF1127 domain-containing protein n=1 Tax=Rhizobium sp. Pop5 TaxID=1223565 RepID=UPI000283B208|nr:DUF1127 domain-containing protein [Rhizobium sp. Pop5]EJZ23198.1 hypothetical protein RCCGEPOP_00877 [Rhizobium sp. Pop5]UVD58108.1 DUF1127 domain-containing protein [Rhizobium sp. Pop5]